MKVKKFLKQQAEKEKQQIIENSDMQAFNLYFEQIGNDEHEKVLPNRSKWLIGVACLFVAMIVAILSVLFFLSKPSSPVYLDSNFEISDSNVEEMDGDMKEFDFNIDDALYSVTVQKTSDSVTGDDLYYRANIYTLDSFINFEFVAVCNENYTYGNFGATDNFTTVELSDYSVTYRQEISHESGTGLDELSAKAIIQKNKESIYIIVYNEYLLDDEGSLLNIIQEMFI